MRENDNVAARSATTRVGSPSVFPPPATRESETLKCGRHRSRQGRGVLSAIRLAGVALTCSLWVQAQVLLQVDYTAGLGERPLVDGYGAPLDDGNQVRIGTFTAAFDVKANAKDLDALQRNWQEFGSSEVRTLLGFLHGGFADSATSSDALFSGAKIYLWAFDTTDDQAPAVDFGNVRGYGLFSSRDASWKFPQFGALPPGNLGIINTTQVDEAFAGAIIGGSPGALQVPEPAAGAVVLGLGLLLFGWVRRGHVHGRP
jgi:hypothetical protein